MGLLDSILGQVLAGGAQPQQGQGQAPDLGALLGGLGGSGGAGGMGDMGNLAGALGGLLANNGQAGGLGGLVSKFEQAGMGDVIGSWIGNGQNAPVSGDQLHQALGGDVVSGLAQKFGMNTQTLLPLLAAVLPMVINHLTPQGQAPAQGLGNQDDLLASLSSMMPRG